MSVKLSPLDKDPLLEEVESEPKLELLETEDVDAERVFSCDSKEVIALSASQSCCSKICFCS